MVMKREGRGKRTTEGDGREEGVKEKEERRERTRDRVILVNGYNAMWSKEDKTYEKKE